MAKPARSLMDLPELEGWLTFGEAAVEMGITPERVRQLVSAPNPRLTTAHRIGRRPLGIIREAEVKEWKRRKEAAAEQRSLEDEAARESAAAAGSPQAGADQEFVDAVSEWSGDGR